MSDMNNEVKEVINESLEQVGGNIPNPSILKYSIEKLIEHYLNRNRYSFKSVMSVHMILRDLKEKIEKD